MGKKKLISIVLLFTFLNLTGFGEVFAYLFNQNDMGIIAEAATIENRLIKVRVTAYTSTVEETDETPFITASGKHVKDGVIANNLLPFGTRVKIPELFGDKIFVVLDRMHPRKKGFVDVWMATKGEARKFGINNAQMLVLN